MGENTGDFQFSPNIKDRYRAQSHFLKTVGEKGERDQFRISGDYGIRHELWHNIIGTPLSPKEYEEIIGKEGEEFKDIINVEALSCFEIFLRDSIERLLVLKKEEPVVILDIGSMAGMSWHRLANYYAEEVKKGKIVFIATAIAYNPDDEETTAPKFRKEYLTTEERDFLKRTKGLVHHINGSISQLRRKRITLPDGKMMPLEHSVDIVHESTSLTSWTKTPDIDILRIPALLSDIGTYFVYSTDLLVMQEAETQKENEERLNGIHLAHNQLVSLYGLKKVDKVEAGEKIGEALNYAVFRKENAPRITVNGSIS